VAFIQFYLILPAFITTDYAKLTICIFLILCFLLATTPDHLRAQGNTKPKIIGETKLMIEEVVHGLELPTSMAFLGPDDILVLEKDAGKVRRIINGSLLPEPLVDVAVGTERERGLLGVATANRTFNGTTHTYAFIFFTASESSSDGTDNCPPPEPYYCEWRNEPIGNRLYRYEQKDNALVNPKLLLEMPATPGPNHNGGVVVVGPDEHVYTVIGDLSPYNSIKSTSKALNFEISRDPDGRGGILRIATDGQTVEGGILGKAHPLNKYYAYGIRNSFGIDFDPISGKLWDTENGPAYSDEINLVEPGFNSGWVQVQGLWAPSNINVSGSILNLLPKNTSVTEIDSDTLSDFHGKGNYSEPEFIWNNPVGGTALTFLDSDKLGKEYENDMFVGDVNNGNIYRFKLNKDRNALELDGVLKDGIANNTRELANVIFAEGFGGVTDIEVGPYDGYLYIVSIRDGKIFRIVPVV
jgi:aldose sugar dehydrogenase